MYRAVVSVFVAVSRGAHEVLVGVGEALELVPLHVGQDEAAVVGGGRGRQGHAPEAGVEVLGLARVGLFSGVEWCT